MIGTGLRAIEAFTSFVLKPTLATSPYMVDTNLHIDDFECKSVFICVLGKLLVKDDVSIIFFSI